MAPAVLEQTAVDISALKPFSTSPRPSAQPGEGEKNEYLFRANGQVVKFDGFIRAYTEGTDEKAEDEIGCSLPELAVEEKLKLHELLPLQHFTEPPPRYTDATLIKALEAHGIGRPSTYAPTLTTIQDRGYVEKQEKKYHPTEEGILVNDLLVEHFPEIVDINFTSHIEEELDDIAEGKIKWQEVAREFYDPFKKTPGRKNGKRGKTGGNIRNALPPLRQDDDYKIWPQRQIPGLPGPGEQGNFAHAGRTGQNK
jgi:DNA topoisomerase-1